VQFLQNVFRKLAGVASADAAGLGSVSIFRPIAPPWFGRWLCWGTYKKLEKVFVISVFSLYRIHHHCGAAKPTGFEARVKVVRIPSLREFKDSD